MARLIDIWKRLAGDRRGSAAIEFAFIAPMLLTMYFVTMEFAPAIDSNKKVGRAASMIADLITQQQEITRSEIDAIIRIGEATLRPYARSSLNVTVTAITIEEDGPVVSWSRKLVDGVFSQDVAEGSATTVPPKLEIEGSFLIRVEAALDYQPMITWSEDAKEATGLLAAFDNIPMLETYYLRPRMSNTVPCDDCDPDD